MRTSIAFILAIGLALLALSATMFDTTTTVVVAITMVIVAVFSGAAVTLGVFTRRAARARHLGEADGTVIRDDPAPPPPRP